MKGYFEVFAIGLKQLEKWLLEKQEAFGLAMTIAVIFMGFTYCKMKENDRDNYGEWTVGEVYDIYSIKASDYYRYQFYVDGVRYTGSTGKGISKICIGDSLYVHYDRTDPSNNVRGDYFEYVLDTEQLPDTVYYRRKMNNQRRPLIYQ